MPTKKQEQVIKYLDKIKSSSKVDLTSELLFEEINTKQKPPINLTMEDFSDVSDEILSSTELLEDLVPLVVKRTYISGSINKAGFKETDMAKNRSTIDIWRHVKFFKPETTIFQVMEILYKGIKKGLYYTVRCPDISRRVFKIRKLRIRNAGSSLAFGFDTGDEFGLHIQDWENISSPVDIVIPSDDYMSGTEFRATIMEE